MSDARNYPRLQSGYTYHICNQGNNREDIFKEERNYAHFLNKYRTYIHPIAHTFAYCLMPNHFHILVQFKTYSELQLALPLTFPKPRFAAISADDVATAAEAAFDEQISLLLSNQFKKFFSGYARSINMTYARNGKLFMQSFNRIMVDNEAYFDWLLAYIHRNPVHHRFCTSYLDWPHSSYQEILTFLQGTDALRNSNSTSDASLLNLSFLGGWYSTADHFLSDHQIALDFLEEKWLLELAE